MSLLNDMLRDLSQRQPIMDGAEDCDENLLKASSLVTKKKTAWLKLSVFFLFIFSAVFGINYIIKQSAALKVAVNVAPNKAESVNNSVAASSEPIAANSTVVATASKTISEPVIVESSSADSLAVESKTLINNLLLQAERAMAMDRLTTPVEDNAYAYYQKILDVSADNEAAKEGLDKIAQRYLSKAQEQAQLGNALQAETLLQRARFVSSRFVDAHTLEFNELSNPTFAAQNSISSSDASVINAQTKAETIKPFVVAEAPSVSVLPNAGWKDEQLARHAQELIQNGRSAEAQELLKNFVANEAAPALSAAVLAELYLQQGNAVAASIILEQAKYFSVDVRAKLKAQIFILQGNNAQAITVLEQNLSAADMNEAYGALLASLYHKIASYPQSILSYQRLMNSFGEKPAYWLGLALAYDGLSQPKNALQAYLRLQEYPQLQMQVKQYTDQRVAALRGE